MFHNFESGAATSPVVLGARQDVASPVKLIGKTCSVPITMAACQLARKANVNFISDENCQEKDLAKKSGIRIQTGLNTVRILWVREFLPLATNYSRETKLYTWEE